MNQSDSRPRRRPAYGLAVGALLLLTVAMGLVRRSAFARHAPVDPEQVAAALADLPRQFGPWQLVAEHALSETAVQMLDCRAYLYRTYRHRTNGREVRVALLAGPGATMAVHVPEICLESRNFAQLKDRTPVTCGTHGEDVLWSVPFQVRDATQRRVQVFYGWSDGGPWRAETAPRWAFAAKPLVFKLQAAVVQPVGESSDDTSVASRFLELFLPHARNVTQLAETEESSTSS